MDILEEAGRHGQQGLEVVQDGLERLSKTYGPNRTGGIPISLTDAIKKNEKLLQLAESNPIYREILKSVDITLDKQLHHTPTIERMRNMTQVWDKEELRKVMDTPPKSIADQFGIRGASRRYMKDNVNEWALRKGPMSLVGKMGQGLLRILKVIPGVAIIPAAADFLGLQSEASAMVTEGKLPQSAYNQYLIDVAHPHAEQVALDPSIVGKELKTQQAFDGWLETLPPEIREEAHLRLRPESLGNAVMDGLESLENAADEYINETFGLGDDLAQEPSALDQKVNKKFQTAAADTSDSQESPSVKPEHMPKA
ncbi:MAG: hypothetical protein DHS20C02_01590 [Micavibrio sp.]|nr:MAG: hypothetical protein DHS20C02_01590 [Micavibrio sp.]